MGEGEDDYDEQFLSQIEEAEAEAIAATRSSNRPKLSAAASGDGGLPENQEEGSYMAALRGSRSSLWQRQQHELGLQKKSVNISGLGSGNSSTAPSSTMATDACFKCGMTGHWARDCGGGQGGSMNRTDESVPSKPCPCGSGTCLVLTSNTEKNPGRMFYRCPLQPENGGCRFFEWCNSPSSGCTFSGIALDGQSKSEVPVLLCPCGAGPCLVVAAKIGKRAGQQYYRCPRNEENICRFFKWCDELDSVPRQSSVSRQFHSSSNISYNQVSVDKTNSSCYKCGQEGHWAKDCQNQPSTVGSSLTTGTCFKCGEPGHWARDCPAKKSSAAAPIKRKYDSLKGTN